MKKRRGTLFWETEKRKEQRGGRRLDPALTGPGQELHLTLRLQKIKEKTDKDKVRAKEGGRILVEMGLMLSGAWVCLITHIPSDHMSSWKICQFNFPSPRLPSGLTNKIEREFEKAGKMIKFPFSEQVIVGFGKVEFSFAYPRFLLVSLICKKLYSVL